MYYVYVHRRERKKHEDDEIKMMMMTMMMVRECSFGFILFLLLLFPVYNLLVCITLYKEWVRERERAFKQWINVLVMLLYPGYFSSKKKRKVKDPVEVERERERIWEIGKEGEYFSLVAFLLIPPIHLKLKIIIIINIIIVVIKITMMQNLQGKKIGVLLFDIVTCAIRQ